MRAITWIAVVVVLAIALVLVVGRELEEFARRYGGDGSPEGED